MFSQQSSSVASTLLDSKSRDVDRRVAAYEKIKTNQKALQRSDVKNALMDLLDRENLYVHKTLEDSDGQEGVGEGFGSYHDDLIQTVMKIADWHNSREVCVLARTEVEPGSRLASMLAKDGGATMVPCLLKIAQGDAFGHKDTAFMESDDRTEAIPLLVEIGAVAGDLSTADQDIASKSDNRRVARSGCRQFGSYRCTRSLTPALRALIPALEDIAHSDPVSRPGNNGVGHPIRHPGSSGQSYRIHSGPCQIQIVRGRVSSQCLPQHSRQVLRNRIIGMWPEASAGQKPDFR